MRKGEITYKGLITQIMKSNDRIIKGFTKLPENKKSELKDLIGKSIELNNEIISLYLEKRYDYID